MAQNKTTPRQNDDLLDSAWRIYKDAQDLIKFADRKINILLIISGVMITFVFNQVGTIKASGDMAYVALAAFLVALSLFLLFSLLALFSRKEAKSGIGVSQLIFFGHIGSRKSADEYYEYLKTVHRIRFCAICAFRYTAWASLPPRNIRITSGPGGRCVRKFSRSSH